MEMEAAVCLCVEEYVEAVSYEYYSDKNQYNRCNAYKCSDFQKKQKTCAHAVNRSAGLRSFTARLTSFHLHRP